jgi:hypothetical protein
MVTDQTDVKTSIFQSIAHWVPRPDRLYNEKKIQYHKKQILKVEKTPVESPVTAYSVIVKNERKQHCNNFLWKQ